MLKMSSYISLSTYYEILKPTTSVQILVTSSAQILVKRCWVVCAHRLPWAEMENLCDFSTFDVTLGTDCPAMLDRVGTALQLHCCIWKCTKHTK